MAARSSGAYELSQAAIRVAHQRAADAHTVEDALRYHDELVDLLAMQAMMVRESLQSEAAKAKAIHEINACACKHRDAVDELTDIIESKRQLVWRH